MKHWIKSRWCAITSHRWTVVHRPGFPNSGLYCQRCEEVRIKDRENPNGVVWVGDHRSAKKFLIRRLRRQIPKATALPPSE